MPRQEANQNKSKILGSDSRLHSGVHVKVIRRNEQANLNVSRANVPRALYFFYEKNTGVSHFHIEARPHGHFPAQQAAGLLPVHRLGRAPPPRAYLVMGQPGPGSLSGPTVKA